MSETPPSSPTPPPPPSWYSTDPGRVEDGPAAVGVPGRPDVPPPWKRVVARFTDEILVRMVMASVVFAVITGESGESLATGSETDSDVGRLVLASIAVLAVSFVWEAVATKVLGGTPMKRAFHMRVVDASTGEEVGWKQAIVRWATFSIWFVVPFLALLLPLVLAIVSLVFLYTKPLRRAVWDLSAKTVVVVG